MRYLTFALLTILLSACEEKTAETPQPAIMEEVYQPKYDLDFLLGKFDPAGHPDFIEIDPKYANRQGLLMQKKAYEAFIDMWSAAREDDIDLVIISATRNFDYQKGIWERKWFGKTLLSGNRDASEIASTKERAREIMLYSAMPGASRHHWGTDIDLNALNNGYFEAGQGLKIFEWLTSHAGEFGFCRPYTDKSSGRTGYEEEKWHWSFLPLSRTMTKDCEHLFEDELLTGFEGSAEAQKLRVKLNYMLGISDECR